MPVRSHGRGVTQPEESVAALIAPGRPVTTIQDTRKILEETMAIAWRRDPDEALAEAKLRGRHVLFDFSAAPM